MFDSGLPEQVIHALSTVKEQPFKKTGGKRNSRQRKEYVLTPYGEIYSGCWRDRKKNVVNNNNKKKTYMMSRK